ncbi:MAG: DUF6470 family protein [Eubacteriales bacterium]
MIDLQVHQQFGKIGLDIKPAEYDLNIKPPEITVKQVPAEIQLEQSAATLEVDYSAFRESLGFGDIEYISKTMANEARQQYNDNLEKSVQEGYSIGAIEYHISIGEVLMRSSAPVEKDLEIVSLSPIRVHFNPGKLEFGVQLGGVSIEHDFGKVTVENFKFPSVKVFMEQEPYLEIQAVGQIYDDKR